MVMTHLKRIDENKIKDDDTRLKYKFFQKRRRKGGAAKFPFRP